MGELQLERGWEGLEGFSSSFGGHKPLSQPDKRGSPVLWGDGPTLSSWIPVWELWIVDALGGWVRAMVPVALTLLFTAQGTLG